MNPSTYHHDFSYLEEVLLSQFEPEIIADTLEASLYAIIQQGLETGEKTGIVMQKFDATFTLMPIPWRTSSRKSTCSRLLKMLKSSVNTYH